MSHTLVVISNTIDSLAKEPRRNKSAIEALMLSRERIERLEAALDVVIEQAKGNGLSAATIYDLESLLCSC